MIGTGHRFFPHRMFWPRAVYGSGRATAPPQAVGAHGLPAHLRRACYTALAGQPNRKGIMGRTHGARRTVLKSMLAAFALAVLSSSVGVTPAESQVQRRNPTLVHARGLVQRGQYRQAIPVLRKFLQTYQSNLEA